MEATSEVRAVSLGGGASGIASRLWHRFTPLARWRVHAIIRTSKAEYSRKEYDASLASALAAKHLASTFGEASQLYAKALFHLAAVHAAMRQHTEALSVLGECDLLATAAHGASSLKRVPILHAVAEVREAEGKPHDYQAAVRALHECTELRRTALGDAHELFAFSCFNEAVLLVHYANETLVMSAAQRAELTSRAVRLGIDAHAAAGVRSSPAFQRAPS